MKSVIRIVGILAASLLISARILAAGLGELSVSSALGQPLQAQIKLLSVRSEDIDTVQVSLATPDEYQQAHIQRAIVLSKLRFSIRKSAGGSPVVHITSTEPIDSPFIDLLVELNWSSGRVLREYTILLDPPKTQTPSSSQEAMAPAATAAGKTATSQPAPAQSQPAKAKSMAAAHPAKVAGPRTYGPVKAGETLRSIAGKLLPADVSMNMMLASLYHDNQKAFIQHNMNLLKKGQVLTVPSRDQIMLMYSPHQANRIVREQVDAWRSIKNRVAGLAATAKVQEVKGKSAESGKIVQAKPTVKPTAQPAGKDILTLSKGESAKSLLNANKRIQALQTELTSKNLALKDAQSRVQELEKTVNDLQRLSALKAKQEATTPGAAATPPAKHTIKPAVKPPVTPPVRTQEPGFFSVLLDNPLYILGGLAVLILLGVLWVFLAGSRRRKGLTDFEQSIMTGGDQFKTSIFRTGGSTAESSTMTQSGASTDFSRLGLGSIDTHEVDPIAEAEVYMAYGRDAQAEEILKEAQAKEPQRHEIALKLLEIYAARRDTASFETQASELYANLGDPAHSIWQKAAEMGRKIDPDNPLYHVFDGSQPPSEEASGESIEPPAETPAMTEAPAEEPAEALEEPAETAQEEPLDMEEHVEAIPSEEPELEAAPAEEEIEGLDFDLPEQEEEEEQPSETEAEEAVTGLDFEPEAEIEAPGIPDFGAEEAEETKEFPTFGKPGEHDLSGLEGIDISAMPLEAKEEEPAEAIELESIQPPEMEAEPEPAEAQLEVPGPEEVETPEEVEAHKDETEEAVTLPDLDFSGIDLELSEPTETETEPEAAEAAQEIEAPPVIDPDLLEEVNTKLDLARAYLEMGDKEGAREILDEVLKEGDDQQQKAANDLIAEIG